MLDASTRSGTQETGPRQEDEASSATPYIPGWLRLGSAWGWRVGALGVGLYLVLKACVILWVAVLPVLLGAILASLLEPVAKGLRRLRVPRSIAGALSVLLSLSLIGGAVFLFGFGVAGELGQLGEEVQSGYRQLVKWSAQMAGVSQETVQNWIDQHLQELQTYAGSIAGQLLNRVQGLLQWLTVVAVTLVFTWFFTWDGDYQFERAVDALPARQREHARELGKRVWGTVGGYMRGLVIIATADALLLGFGLWLLGLPLVLPLMLLMFLGAFVPFVGPILAGAMAALVALSHGGVTTMGLAILIAAAVQQVEGNLLQPFIMGRAVKLHPAMVLFAITAGGVLAGVIGVFLAIPIAASLATVLGYAWEHDATEPYAVPPRS